MAATIPESIPIVIHGPFTLRIGFVLTKDGREDVGNLLGEQGREYVRNFETLPEALEWLRTKIERMTEEPVA